MSNLIALPIGYQHEPQESANINTAAVDVPNIICRLILNANDPNAGYLDGALRVFPAIPAVGDTVSLTGTMLAQTINLEIVDVLPQDESYVARAGGPLYILAARTI